MRLKVNKLQAESIESMEWFTSSQVVESSSQAQGGGYIRPHVPADVADFDVSNWAQVKAQLLNWWRAGDTLRFPYVLLSSALRILGVVPCFRASTSLSLFIDEEGRYSQGVPRLCLSTQGLVVVDGRGILVPVAGQAYLNANRFDAVEVERLGGWLSAHGVYSYLRYKVVGRCVGVAWGRLVSCADSLCFEVVPSPESEPLAVKILEALE